MAEHMDAHLKGETITHLRLRAQHVVDWATRGGAHALGRDDLGSLAPGMKADVVLIKNDDSPVSFPLLNPYGHVAFQAQRGDVHTVLVDGRVVKHAGKLVGIDLAPVRREIEATIEYLRGECGEEIWQQGMFPEMPDAEASILENPYQYTDYKDESKREARSGPRPVTTGAVTLRPRVEARDAAQHRSRQRQVDGGTRRRTGLRRGTRARARRPRLLRRRPPQHVAQRGGDRGRAGPAHGAAAAADPRGARLRPVLAAAPSRSPPRCSRSAWPTSARSGSGTSPARTSRRSSRAPASRRPWRSSTARTSSTSPGCRCPKLIALRVDIGTRFPAVQTSQGKVLLAALSPDELEAALAAAQPGRAAALHRPLAASACGDELTEVRARGWALADEELAPGVRSVAVPVRDGTGAVRAAMNVTVHAAETSTERLLQEHLPLLLRTAGDVSAEWALWQSRPHVDRRPPRRGGSATG